MICDEIVLLNTYFYLSTWNSPTILMMRPRYDTEPSTCASPLPRRPSTEQIFGPTPTRFSHETVYSRNIQRTGTAEIHDVEEFQTVTSQAPYLPSCGTEETLSVREDKVSGGVGSAAGWPWCCCLSPVKKDEKARKSNAVAPVTTSSTEIISFQSRTKFTESVCLASFNHYFYNNYRSNIR